MQHNNVKVIRAYKQHTNPTVLTSLLRQWHSTKHLWNRDTKRHR